ncbi:MAG: lysine exporter LysO family protein [Bacillota bacterium]|nr:lysine exporter LysO family protein [Bacillota bacterium]
MIWLAAGLLGGILLYLTGFGKAWGEGLWEKAMTGLLVLLLLSIGIQLGLYPDLKDALSRLGLWSLVLAVGGAGGAFLAGFLYPLRRENGVEKVDLPKGEASSRKIWVLAALAVGAVILGTGVGLGAASLGMDLSLLAEGGTRLFLVFLLVLIGRQMASQGKDVWQRARAEGWHWLFRPFLGAAGTLLGAWGAALIFAIPLPWALGSAAGFGWYSFTGVVLTQLGGPEAGILGFLGNLFREVLTVILVPFLVALLPEEGRWRAVLPGGATTMDTTLPLYAAATDAPTASFALVHGAVLSLLAPLLVPFFFGWGG